MRQERLGVIKSVAYVFDKAKYDVVLDVIITSDRDTSFIFDDLEEVYTYEPVVYHHKKLEGRFVELSAYGKFVGFHSTRLGTTKEGSFLVRLKDRESVSLLSLFNSNLLRRDVEHDLYLTVVYNRQNKINSFIIER